MTGAAQPFQFRLDLASGVPVYRQLIEQVRAAIARPRGLRSDLGSREIGGVMVVALGECRNPERPRDRRAQPRRR